MRRSLSMFYVIDNYDGHHHYVMDDFGNLVQPPLCQSILFVLGEY